MSRFKDKADFPRALRHLRSGLICRRAGWPAGFFLAHHHQPDGKERIWLFPAPNNQAGIQWEPAQDDLLAHDWVLDQNPYNAFTPRRDA